MNQIKMRLSNIFRLSNVLYHNYLMSVLDGGFFGLAMGFASYTTVIPLFLNTLTGSALLIGLIPSIRGVGYQLPPLFMAGSVSRQKFFKPMMLRNTLHERLPFLGMALVAWFSPQLGSRLTLILFFLLIVWQGLGGGITANPLQNLVARLYPSKMRATVIGTQSSASSLLASAGAVAAGLILSRLPSPANYAACFLIAVLWLLVSYGAMANFIEPEPERSGPEAEKEPVPVNQHASLILKEDRSFLWFLVSRILIAFATMAAAFYMIFAVRKFGIDATTAGLMTSALMITQVLASPLIGYISDRWSRKGVMEIGGIFLLLAPVLAWLAPQEGWFYGVFVLSGISNAIFFTLGTAFLLEYGTDKTRPTYFGLANTLIAPASIIAPLLGGWLADTTGFRETFLLAAAAGLLAFLTLRFLVVDPRAQNSVQIS